MIAQQTQELAEQFIDALHTLEEGSSEHDLDALVALFSEDARLINAALKLAGEELTGTDGARKFWTAYRKTFDAAYSDFYQVTVNQTCAGLFWTTRGTGHDGLPKEYDGVTLLGFDDDGKITLLRGYYDTRELARAVGAGIEAHPPAHRSV